MVKGPLRLLAIVILALPLSACIFVASVFPATLSQIVARADLSAVIPAKRRVPVPAIHRHPERWRVRDAHRTMGAPIPSLSSWTRTSKSFRPTASVS